MGVAQCFKETAERITKAAEQGHANAQFNLGLCYAARGACTSASSRRSSVSPRPWSALFSFGCGSECQLGHGDTADQLAQVEEKVVALAKEGAVSVTAGGYHSLALTAEGALFSFGRGDHGAYMHSLVSTEQA